MITEIYFGLHNQTQTPSFEMLGLYIIQGVAQSFKKKKKKNTTKVMMKQIKKLRIIFS